MLNVTANNDANDMACESDSMRILYLECYMYSELKHSMFSEM